MDETAVTNYVNQRWDESIIPELKEYIRIPNKSVAFDPEWAPPGNQLEQGKALLAQYHIDNSHLTDCTVCHR